MGIMIVKFESIFLEQSLLGVVVGMQTHPKLCFMDKKHKYKNQHPHHQKLKHISLSRKYSA